MPISFSPPADRNLRARGAGVTAVLGPTNTGKTHLAIERMLAHSSGVIGLPLRLLAREVYNRAVERVGADGFEAEVVIGIGGIRGVYAASIRIAERREAQSLRMDFRARGRLGHGRGSAWIDLSPQGAGSKLAYRYAADVGGTVAAVGSRMLGSVTRVLIAQFFKAFEQYGKAGARRSPWSWLQDLFRR